MSRLQSAGRDYAIAVLSARNAELTSRDAVEPAMDASQGEDWSACFAAFCDCEETHPRLVRARLALYLRCLRRAEAWERARARDEADRARDRAWERQMGAMCCPHDDTGPDDWAYPPTYRDPLPDSETTMEAFRAWAAAPRRDRAWSPLWLSAPAWDPGITPAMRRKT